MPIRIHARGNTAMTLKRMVCLAKSWRPGGMCIAGREIVNGQIGGWVRPVDLNNDDAVRPSVVNYERPDELQLLDVVELDLGDYVPRDHQQENWSIRPNRRIRRVGRFDRDELVAICDNTRDLWRNGSSSSIGHNNRVRYAFAKQYRDSLRLIRVERLRLTVYENEHRDETRLKGTFDHGGETYTMQVKDVEFENECQERDLGTYVAQDRYLTISLAGEFNDYCYKLIAGIM